MKDKKKADAAYIIGALILAIVLALLYAFGIGAGD